DHGVAEAPQYLLDVGAKKPEYFDLKTLLNHGIYDQLKAEFGVGEALIERYAHPYIYLDHDLIKEKKLSLAEVQSFLASKMENIKGIERAITSSQIDNNQLADTRINQLVVNSHYKGRSGDIFPVFSSQRYINDFDGLVVASSHGSPWRYDTYVPVIFAGAGLKAETVSREITPYDIAPTLSNYLGITLPSGSTGEVLKEVVK
ncbi:MAG: alkaline phosphatase family protein, partial [Psychromonas sp.]|nr:alkaline phosphatase family protein [Psychromonas sp.]